MNGKQHLAIGAVVGVIPAVAILSTEPSFAQHLGITTWSGRIAVSAALCPFAGLVLEDDNPLTEKVSSLLGNIVPKMTRVIVPLILFLFLMVASLTHVGSILIYTILGSVVGSLIPDLDSSRTIINRKFNRALLILVPVIAFCYYAKIDVVTSFLESAKCPVAIILLVVLIILSKCSPHRQFTHKWFGTVCYGVLAFFIFPEIFAIAFMCGYMSHILADRTTKAGKDLKFFYFCLPCQSVKRDKRGRLYRTNIDFKEGLHHLALSMKVGTYQ